MMRKVTLIIAALFVIVFSLFFSLASSGEGTISKIYHKQCATCHGNNGDGQGRAGASLSSVPTDFTSTKNKTRLSLEKIELAIRDGISGTAMSAYGRRFDAATIQALASYIQRQFMVNSVIKVLGSVSKSNKSEGRALYIKHCAACHGDNGNTAVWAKNALDPAPRNFTSAGARSELSIERMVMSVTYGRPGTAMMSFDKRLDAKQIRTVIDFIRGSFMQFEEAPPETNDKNVVGGTNKTHVGTVDMSLPFPQGLKGDVDAGKVFFQNNCFSCHGKKGNGKGPRSHFNFPRPRNFTSEESRQILNRPRLFNGISHGKPRTVMPAWATVLNEQQIADVAEYVFQYFVQTGKKKVLNKADLFTLGQRIYNYRCYFCHGYAGDAKTLASTYLEPKPVAFTKLQITEMTFDAMQKVVQFGKKNTAMMSFSRQLENVEIRAVVSYVRQSFMQKNEILPEIGGADEVHDENDVKKLRYHTVENGWPDHAKYRDAFSFVSGELSPSTPNDKLSTSQRRGRQLYLSACISCHDRSQRRDEGLIWESYPLSWPRNAYSNQDDNSIDSVSQASPFHVHDIEIAYDSKTETEKKGQRIFRENCVFCHAADGSGKHWIGQFIQPHARDFTRQPIQKLYSKQTLKERISEGVSNSAMPAWRYVLDEEDIESVVHYMWRRFN